MGSSPDNKGTVKVTFSHRPAGSIATVAISNPTRLNSLNTPVLDAFISTISSLAKTPNLRCVIVTGGPCAGIQQAFCGGADISEAKDFPDSRTARTFITKLHLVCRGLRDLPVPVISRANGHALGGGMVVMAVADLRIATADATFGMPEVQRGVASTIDSALLPAQIGAGRARRLLMLGDTISARQAESWGLVDKVVERHELDNAVENWVELLLKAGPRALAAQKRLMTMWEQVPAREAAETGIWEFGRAWEEEGLEAEGRRMMQEFSVQNNKRKKGKL